MGARNFYEETTARLEKALQFCDDTKAVVIGDKTLDSVGDFFKKLFDVRKAIVVAKAPESKSNRPTFTTSLICTRR